MPIHGFETSPDWSDPLHVYGSVRAKLRKRIAKREESSLSEKFPLFPAMIRHAVRKEMAITLEDMLARRTRSILFDARETRELAPRVAALMAKYLGEDEAWIQQELAAFETFSAPYVVEA